MRLLLYWLELHSASCKDRCPAFAFSFESCFGYDACANLELFLMRLPYLKKIYAGHVISKRFHGSGCSSPCYSRNGHIAKAMNANTALAH